MVSSFRSAAFWLYLALAAISVVALGIYSSPPNRRGKVRAESPSIEMLSRDPDWVALPVARSEMGYELLMFLNDAHVQRELQISSAQSQALAALAQSYLQEVSLLPPATGGASAEETQIPRLKALRKHSLACLEILSPAQLQRLDQVMFQLRSIDIYSEPAFVAELKLTESQREQIASVRGSAEVEMRGLRTALAQKTLDRAAYENAVHAGLVAADGQADAVLAEAQQSHLASWRGRQIEFGRMHLRLGIRGQQVAARQ